MFSPYCHELPGHLSWFVIREQDQIVSKLSNVNISYNFCFILSFTCTLMYEKHATYLSTLSILSFQLSVPELQASFLPNGPESKERLPNRTLGLQWFLIFYLEKTADKHPTTSSPTTSDGSISSTKMLISYAFASTLLLFIYNCLVTPPKFNIAPENGGWKTTFLLGRSLFRGYVKLREGTSMFSPWNSPDH